MGGMETWQGLVKVAAVEGVAAVANAAEASRVILMMVVQYAVEIAAAVAAEFVAA